MVSLRCLYRRQIAREMIGLVARASTWLARNPPRNLDHRAVGLALFRAVLQEKPTALCAALATCGVTIDDLLEQTDAIATRPESALQPDTPPQTDPTCEVLYSEELAQSLEHWMDAAEVQARIRADPGLLPEHVLLVILAAEGPWKEVLTHRGLSLGALRAALEEELGARVPSVPEPSKAWIGLHSAAKWLDSPAVGVPRRFGVGGMLVIVTMFALLYGGLQWSGAPPPVFLAVAVFFAGMALAQMLLRGGHFPRAASVKMGALLWPVEVFFWVLYEERNIPGGPGVGLAVVMAAINVPIGAFLGYLGGCLVAGVVLLLDKARGLRNRLRRAGETGEPVVLPSETPPAASP